MANTVNHGPILDLEEEEEEGTVASGDQLGILKRGSTQATAAEGIAHKQDSSEARFTSPYMQSMNKQASMLSESIKEKKKRSN